MNRSVAAIVLALALAVVVALAAVAHADPPVARGVTAEVEGGVALIGAPDGIGIAPTIGGGVGVFVHDRVAVSLRLAAAIAQYGTAGMAGAHVEVWLGRVWLGAGGGVGFVAGCNCVEGGAHPGLEGQLGVAISQKRHGRLGVALEAQLINPLQYPGTGTLSIALGYQTF